MAGARGRSRVRFTPELWRKWLARDPEDGHARELRDGINEMRNKCEDFAQRTRGNRKIYWDKEP